VFLFRVGKWVRGGTKPPRGTVGAFVEKHSPTRAKAITGRALGHESKTRFLFFSFLEERSRVLFFSTSS
jgi:hypothetical protein